MALLMAIITCGVFSIFSFPFRHYQSWYSWGRLPTNGLLAVYATLTACGGGTLGWGIANLAHAVPTALPWWNGVLFGFGGLVALRAAWKPERLAAQDARRTRAVGQMQDASTLLAKAVAWAANALDDAAHRRATTWLKSLSDRDLMDVVWDVQADIDNRLGNSTKAKEQLLANLVTQMELLANQGEAKAAARAHLVSFCAKYLIQEHRPKPDVTAAAAHQSISSSSTTAR